MLDDDHKKRLLEALLNHEHQFVYKYLLRNDRSEVVEFAIGESLRLTESDRNNDADSVLMTLVHCQVNPNEVVGEAFRQGINSQLRRSIE